MNAQRDLLTWLLARTTASDFDRGQALALLEEGWPEAVAGPPPPAVPQADTVTVPAGTNVVFSPLGGGNPQ